MRSLILAILLTCTVSHAQDVVWVRNGENADSHFGAGLYSVGDQNDDGFADWAVASVDGFYFFQGGDPPSQTPYLTLRSRQNPTQVMHNNRSIGDINGDGYEDWWIFYWEPGSDSVALELYGGGPNADTIPEQVIHLDYDSGDDFGDRIGDHNGDGYDDYYYYRRATDVSTFYLGCANWDSLPDFMNQGQPIGSRNSIPSYGVFGDFNGDGFDDYLTGTAPPNEHTYVFYGSTTPDTIPDIDWIGNYDIPATLSADVNNDGAADLIVTRTQALDVHLGGASPSPTPTFVLSWPDCPDGSSNYVYSAGDYNRDGYEDFVGISEGCANGFGALQLYLGGPWLNPDPVLRIEGVSLPPFDEVPVWRAVGLGDVNGDGIEDLAIGCQGNVLDGRRGRVVILSGDTTYHVPIGNTDPFLPEEIPLAAYPNPFNPTTTLSFTLPRSAVVALTIRNVLGQEVESVNIGRMSAGEHRYAVNAERWASGIYFATLNIAAQTHTTKLLLIR